MNDDALKPIPKYMIKKTCVFFFVMLAHFCSGQKMVEKIKGNWIYSYSFKADTVIIFTEISQSTDPYLAAEYIFVSFLEIQIVFILWVMNFQIA
jgi:hypothetical protein